MFLINGWQLFLFVALIIVCNLHVAYRFLDKPVPGWLHTTTLVAAGMGIGAFLSNIPKFLNVA